MRFFSICIFFLLPCLAIGQNIRVDAQGYSAQELVEDVLINSSCIENVTVTNVVGGNFNSNDRSYGYFEANGSNFPFQSGIILATGKISNAQGPNTTLSDDNAPNWTGDADLENILNEPNTINATILEFDFMAIASQISFRYIFASEEYQENDPNTCRYSDLFGFLIKPASSGDYTNIALVPGTQTPVKVTTVHSGIPGSCEPINAFYFEGWNGPSAPINYNGQTKILTATANVVPNETYHVKLVIADEQNYRYDSAVFLEAGSFQLSTDLGPNLLTSTRNAVCFGETHVLDASQANATDYKWFKNGVELPSETASTYTVTDPGTYNVEVSLGNGCIAYGEVVVEYYSEITAVNATLSQCDQDQDGLTFYDLYDAESVLTGNSNFVSNFFLDQISAVQNTNPIADPRRFRNTVPGQTVFARIENGAECFRIAELYLSISSNVLVVPPYNVCDDDPVDGFTEFNLDNITTSFLNQIPTDATVAYFLNEEDAYNSNNSLGSPFVNTTVDSQELYIKVLSNNQCFAVSTVQLNVLYVPQIEADETVYYCQDSYPQTVRLYGGVINDAPNNYYYQWFFNGNPTVADASIYDVNETGIYTVVVTDPNGCSNQRNITVLPSNAATIEHVNVQDGTSNNTVTVSVSGNGDYVFALDNPNGPYQESSVFYNVAPGLHTVYVIDQNGCGISQREIAVIGFPKFFTPNGDNQNETWQIYGVNEQFYTEVDIKIYNRYGKLLAHQNYWSGGWDGTFKGRPLPSDDYWFVVTLPDGRIFKGHFALVR